MSELLSVDDRASSILDAIAEPDDNAAPAAQENIVDNSKTKSQPAENATETADDTAPDAEQVNPDIDAPVGWKAEAKARFDALTPELKQDIAERDRERERGSKQAAQKALEASKAADAEREALRAERARYADQLKNFVDVAKVNPKLAEWRARDWAQYSLERPVEAQAEWHSYQKAEGAIGAAETERKQIEHAIRAEMLTKANDTLSAKLDFWNDPVKRTEFQKEFRAWGKTADLSDADMDGITDPRVILVAHKAMLYDKLMAQQTQIAAKKPPVPTKVLKPQATGDDDRANPRAKALAMKAAKTGKLDDRAAAILAALD